MKLRFIFRALIPALVLSLVPILLYAQSTGTIAGTVTDTTGALVPGAAVTVVNMATKDTRRTVSDGQGIFSVPGLVDGDYSIEIEAKTFKSWEVSGVHVLPGSRVSIPGIALEVGAQTEVVEVQGTAAQMQISDSGDRVSQLDSQEVQNLGLEGRDVTELIRTQPGWANTGSGLGNTMVDFQRTGIVAGSQMLNYTGGGIASGSGGQDLISDGARVIDPGCNCSATQTINADMVAEVKVTESAYSASSWHGPVVVEAVGKSGTSTYHGEVYLHNRDAVLNANSYAFKQNGESRFPSRYTYPGGSFGGPVRIPGTSFNKKNKLVFWAGYEYVNQVIPDFSTGGLLMDNLPTLSERQGLFDPTLPDNATNCGVLTQASSTAALSFMRCPGAGGITSMIVPSTASGQPSVNYVGVTGSNISSLIGPGALAWLSQTPKPNTTPTVAQPFNYVAQVPTNEDGFTFHARVDYAFSDNAKLYVSYNNQHDNEQLAVGQYFQEPNGAAYPAGMEYLNRSQTLAGNFVKVFNPTFINEATASLAYVHIPVVYNASSKVTKAALNFPYTNIGAASKYMPYLGNIGSYINGNGSFDLGFPSLGMPDISNYYSTKITPGATDTVTLIAGKHSIKFGFNWQDVANKQLNVAGFGSGPNGTVGEPIYAFWAPPGNPFGFANGNENTLADFMTDFTSGYSDLADLGIYLGVDTIGAFLQDDWKITSKLTLTMGVRLDHFGAVTDRSSGGNGIAVFSANNYIADGGASAPSGGHAPGIRTHTIDPETPLSGRSVPLLEAAPRFGMAYDVFGTGKTVVRGGYGLYYYPDNYNNYSSPVGQGNGSKTCSVPTGPFTSSSAFFGNQTYSTLASLNAGMGLVCSTSNAYNNTAYAAINAADPEDRDLALTYTYNFAVSQRTYKNSVLEVAYSGNQSVNQLTSVNVNAIPLGAYFTQSQYTPYDITNASAPAQLTNSFRPMPNYAAVNLTQHRGWGNYNAMQISWNKMGGSLSYGLNYTWSKTMGLLSTLADPIDLHNDYGPTAGDRAQVLNVTYSYAVGRLIKGNAILANMVNGWRISGISSVQSGANIQTNDGQNFGLTGTTSIPVTSGPNRTPVTQNGAPVYETPNGAYYLGSADYTLIPKLTCSRPSSGDKSGQYFNANCFAVPAPQTYNQRYWLPYTTGPIYYNNDLTMAKTFKFKERNAVEFKASGFNFLNKAVPGFSGSSTGDDILTYNQGNLVSTAIVPRTGAPVPVGTSTTKNGQRIVELSIKYSF